MLGIKINTPFFKLLFNINNRNKALAIAGDPYDIKEATNANKAANTNLLEYAKQKENKQKENVKVRYCPK